MAKDNGKPVRDGVKQVDEYTWLIGEKFLLHRSTVRLGGIGIARWKDADGSYYTLTDAPTPLPAASALPSSPHITKVHDLGDASAVFSIGDNAFCKIKEHRKDEASEAATLKFLHNQKAKFSFEIPKVLHYTEEEDRIYLFLTSVPGQTLMKICPNLNDRWRQHYLRAAVQAIKDLAKLKGDKFGGVDGRNVPECYLAGGTDDVSSAKLQKACQDMGMDCSNYVFQHADLGPGNVIVNPASGNMASLTGRLLGIFLWNGL